MSIACVTIIWWFVAPVTLLGTTRCQIAMEAPLGLTITRIVAVQHAKAASKKYNCQ